MYPHQVLMEENNLTKETLSPEAKEYLKDFNHFHRGVSLKESRAIKKGKEFTLSESEANKLNRFSKSVALQIYEDLQVVEQAKKAEEEKQRKIEEDAKELARQQAEEDARIKAENDAKKAAEEEAVLENERLEEERLQALQREAEKAAEEEKLKEEELNQPPPQPVKQEKEGTGLFDYFF